MSSSRRPTLTERKKMGIKGYQSGPRYLKPIRKGGNITTLKNGKRIVKVQPKMKMVREGGALRLAGMGGAIGLAGAALKLAGQGANFKRLGKAEQERVMMAILKRLHQVKQQGGLRIGALDLSMLPDIGSAIREVFEPKTALGRAIRKRVFAAIKARTWGDVLKGALTGEGAIGLAGGAVLVPEEMEGGMCRPRPGLLTNPATGLPYGKKRRKKKIGGYGTKAGASKNRFLTKQGASTNPWIMHKNAVFRKYKNSGKSFAEINKIASATYKKAKKKGRGRPKKYY
jgi:hypothetical protein